MTYIAASFSIKGFHLFPPGWSRVKTKDPEVTIDVRIKYPKEVKIRNEIIDVSDCFTAEVLWVNLADTTEPLPPYVRELFEQGLEAISEVMLWLKSRARKGDESVRQVGPADVKLFTISNEVDWASAWLNPSYNFPRDGVKQFNGMFGNARHANDSQQDPLDNVSRRVYASLDLINLGFLTEAFINLFSLVDDQIQSLWRHAFDARGISRNRQKELLYLEENRLHQFLCKLPLEYGWESLEIVKPELYEGIRVANALRNNIMHKNSRLTRRGETITHINPLLDLIEWLETNPFAYFLPKLPTLRIVDPTFLIIRDFRPPVSTDPDPIL